VIRLKDCCIELSFLDTPPLSILSAGRFFFADSLHFQPLKPLAYATDASFSFSISRRFRSLMIFIALTLNS